MNNFDTSTTGENITFSCFYDTHLAKIYYDDFEVENIRLEIDKGSCLFLIGNASAPYYKKSELNKMKKGELIALDNIYQLLCPYDYSEVSKAELINELQHVTIYRHYKHLVSEYSWRDISENITHDYYISRGYSQGDAVYIVSIDKPIDNDYKKSIDCLLWDAPINIQCTVNDAEFLEDSFMDDLYNYDKAEIAKKIQGFNISDYAKNWLINALPECPSY